MSGLLGQSPFVSRAEWGARPANGISTNITPTGNTLHWEGPKMGTFPHTSCASKVRGIQAFHMDGRGWSDIAYSSLECPHGYIFEGRWLGKRTAAQGTNQGNQTSYAHCLLMGDGDPLTDLARRAARDVFQHFESKGSGGNRWAHSDWHSTMCCGNEARAFLRGGMVVPSGTPATPVPTDSFRMTRIFSQPIEGIDNVARRHVDLVHIPAPVTDGEGDGGWTLPYAFNSVGKVALNLGDQNALGAKEFNLYGEANSNGKHRVIWKGPPNMGGGGVDLLVEVFD